jgi:tetratricopeptide (TPR) repeat protein
MKQTTESFLRMQAIFHEALELPEDERAAFIDGRCLDDKELAAEVRLLIEASREEEEQSEAGRTGGSGGTGGASGAHSGSGADSGSAQRPIGPYRLDRLIGRGGMGAVYLAHRADGQFEQRVAIKLIDLPLATELFRERFRQERQILAGLQHPYIARMLDGGITADGDLYLAMEYVDGVPIHRFCEAHNLTLPERLALFLRVCEAVQYAHQNLVVHRDLKPDNIFVVEDGTPRLLDFGTAKLLSPSLGNPGSEMTREGYQSFTPQYASPEQVLGNPITTASDTYSLGVLLYVLVTGSLPYELKELTTAEMLRVICEEPPRRPSHEVGADRKLRAARKLDPDLDAILMKALRKEPLQRYLTAQQLAADVQAWLDHKPVAARRGTFRYRASKFVVRHRVGIAGATLLVVSLAAGIAGILWQSREANLQRRKAEARSADLRQLSKSLLSELDEAIKQLPGSTGVQKLLVTRVLEHLDRMAADAQGDRLTQIDLADAYTRLANIQGNPYDQNLGDPAGGLASDQKAIDLARSLVDENPRDRDALRALATAEDAESEILFGTARTQEAITAMQAATRDYDRLIETRDATPALICEVAAAYGTLGDEWGQTGTASLSNTAEGLRAYRKTIELDDRALSIDPNFLRARRGLALTQMKIGSEEMEADPGQALKDYQIAIEKADALPKDDKNSYQTMRMRTMIQRKKANAHVLMGQYAEAMPLFAQVVEFHRKMVAVDPQDLRALADLEVILDDEAVALETAADPALAAPGNDSKNERGRILSQACDTLREVVAIMDKMLRQDPTNENWRFVRASAQVRLATDESTLNQGQDTEPLARAGLAAFKEMAQSKDASAMVLESAATAFTTVQPASLRDPRFAVACAERAVDESHRQRPAVLLTLAQALNAAGQLEQARQVAKEALALLPPQQPGAARSNIRKQLEFEAQGGATVSGKAS